MKDKKLKNEIKEKKSSLNRRKLLKTIAAGSGAVVAGKTLPDSWSKPVVDSVLLPAHAQTSPVPEQRVVIFDTANDNFEAPPNITGSSTILAIGAGGQVGADSGEATPGAGGPGGQATGTMAVTPGQTFAITLDGSHGTLGTGGSGAGGSWADGGDGGAAAVIASTSGPAAQIIAPGGGGGGGGDGQFRPNDRSYGGNGSGGQSSSPGDPGGNGDQVNGGPPFLATGGTYPSGGGGCADTQFGQNGTPGTLGNGGGGGESTTTNGGGGGAGGAGSSSGAVSGVAFATDTNTGGASVQITYTVLA